MTDYKTKCSILNQVWLTYRYEDEFEDFIEYNDLGLPLAAMIDEEIIAPGSEEVNIPEVEEVVLG